MSSFAGSSTLAMDAMRSFMRATRERVHHPFDRPTILSRNQVWNPSHGIVFARAENSRTISSISTTLVDRDISQTSVYGHSMVPTTTNETRQCDQRSFHSASLGSDGATDANWVPSDTTASAHGASIRDPESQIAELMLSGAECLINAKSLSFSIPDDVLRRAKIAEPGTPASYWSYKMYSGPEDQKVKVHYCRTKHTTERVLQQYFQNQSVLGFDIEWQPEATRAMSIKKNVALIQLASEERVALFHLALFAKDDIEGLVAPTLKKIMEDPNITKVGVAIKADCTRLRKYLEIDSKGVFELSHLYKLVKYSSSGDYKSINKRLVSLGMQVEDILKLPLFKGDVVRGSNWSEPLNLEQLYYAASDTYAGFILYHVLEEKRQNLDPIPPRPYNADLNEPIRLADGVVVPADPAVDEAEEPEPDAKTVSITTTLPRPSVEVDDVHLEDEEVLPEASNKAATSTTTKPKATIPQSDSYTAAEAWATSYRASHPIPPGAPTWSYVGAASLRAYALWQQHNLDVSAITATVRNPPLKETTVSTYILEAIRVEKLPYDKARLKAVLEGLPRFTKDNWRYRTLWTLVKEEGENQEK